MEPQGNVTEGLRQPRSEPRSKVFEKMQKKVAIAENACTFASARM
jgi:hypothetical protein